MRARVKYWLVPGQRSIELIAADYVAQRFSPHWHAGFAVGVVTRNMQGFRANGRDWVVGPGDLILINPGQVHDGWSLHVEGWTSRMAYIPESTFASLKSGANGGDHLPLRFQAPVLHAPALAAMFAGWHASTEGGRDGCDAMCMGDVLGALMRLMRLMRSIPIATGLWKSGAALSFELGERLRKLSEEWPSVTSEWLPTPDVSRTTSWRRIRRHFGLGPQALQTHLRLVAAKRLLAAGRPVADTAHEIGCHDQSHFTRQFTAAYGMTPAQFRRAQFGTQ
ncbi:MAG: AraC family transcriptional regulator [Burkholderiaceae bacterium]